MKKILTILFLLSFIYSFGQPITPRSNGSITVQDYRAYPKLNFIFPTYTDTGAANSASSIGLNLTGASIYTLSDNKFWIRKSLGGATGIYWAEVTGGGAADSATFATQYDVSVGSVFCPVRLDTLQVKKIRNGVTDVADYAFPNVERTNSGKLIYGVAKVRNHTFAGLAQTSYSTDDGATRSAWSNAFSSDTNQNLRVLIPSKLRGDTISRHTWSGLNGRIYIQYSVDDGVTWSATDSIQIGGVVGATEGKIKVFNDMLVMPGYSYSPDPDKSGIFYKNRVTGGSWTVVWFPNDNALQLNECTLVVDGDSLIAFVRSELHTDSIYRTATVDLTNWTTPHGVPSAQYYRSKPDVIKAQDGRYIINYRSVTPNQGIIAISGDKGLSWDSIYAQQQGYWYYGNTIWMGDNTYLNVHCGLTVSPTTDMYQDYYIIPGCDYTQNINNQKVVKPNGVSFVPLKTYIDQKIDAAPNFLHTTDVDESAAGNKRFLDTLRADMLFDLRGNFVQNASGNTGGIIVGGSGGFTPPLTGLHTYLSRDFLSTYTYPSTGYSPFTIYNSATKFYFLSGTGDQFSYLDATGVLKRSSVNISSVLTSVPSLQDVFGAQSNVALFTAANEININGHDFTIGDNSDVPVIQFTTSVNQLGLIGDTVVISVGAGAVKISDLQNLSTQNAILGQITSSDKIGYLTNGYGISIGSGNVRADTATLFSAVRATIPTGGSSSLVVGTTPITNNNDRSVLYDSSGILKQNSSFIYNAAGELLVGGNADGGAAKLQVNGGSALFKGILEVNNHTFYNDASIAFAVSDNSRNYLFNMYNTGNHRLSLTRLQGYMRLGPTIASTTAGIMFQIDPANTTDVGQLIKGIASQSGDLLQIQNSSATNLVKVDAAGKVSFDATLTAGGTTGNQTINKAAGSVNIAAAGTTITVTNSMVTTSSLVQAWCMTNDATAIVKNVTVASGSFTVTLNAAATAETKIGFIVNN